MLNAIFRGVIGVAIGCGIVILCSLSHSSTWTLTEIMVAVGLASFFGPFSTALIANKPDTSTVDTTPISQ